jgi:hypothetical protein
MSNSDSACSAHSQATLRAPDMPRWWLRWMWMFGHGVGCSEGWTVAGLSGRGPAAPPGVRPPAAGPAHAPHHRTARNRGPRARTAPRSRHPLVVGRLGAEAGVVGPRDPGVVALVAAPGLAQVGVALAEVPHQVGLALALGGLVDRRVFVEGLQPLARGAGERAEGLAAAVELGVALRAASSAWASQRAPPRRSTAVANDSLNTVSSARRPPGGPVRGRSARQLALGVADEGVEQRVAAGPVHPAQVE